MSEFKVSIIIPVYNREKFITRAVESCIYLPQAGEIIIVDDGSTDKSLNIALELASKYPIVKVLQHPDKKNHGRSAARNLGIVNANNNYIAFLDSDDWYLPNRFENEERIFRLNRDVDGVYGITDAIFESDAAKKDFFKRFDSSTTKVIDNINSESLYRSFLMGGMGRFTTDAITFKKKIFDKIGLFDTRFVVMQDTHLWCKIASKYKLVSNQNPSPIAIRGVHSGNSIINSDSLRHELEYLMTYDWFNWALRQNDFSYDKKNDFFIGYKKMYPQESEFKTFLKFLIRNPRFLFNRYTYRKLVQTTIRRNK